MIENLQQMQLSNGIWAGVLWVHKYGLIHSLSIDTTILCTLAGACHVRNKHGTKLLYLVDPFISFLLIIIIINVAIIRCVKKLLMAPMCTSCLSNESHDKCWGSTSRQPSMTLLHEINAQRGQCIACGHCMGYYTRSLHEIARVITWVCMGHYTRPLHEIAWVTTRSHCMRLHGSLHEVIAWDCMSHYTWSLHEIAYESLHVHGHCMRLHGSLHEVIA